MLGDDGRPRLDAVGQQHAQEHRGGHAAGDPEQEGRNQVAGFDGVVGAFGAHDAARVALAELALVLRRGDRLAVGQPGSGGGADAGQDAGPDADQGSANNLGPVGEPLADAVAVAAAQRDRLLGAAALSDAGGDLGEAEDPEGDGDEGEPVAEEQAAEGEPVLGGGR